MTTDTQIQADIETLKQQVNETQTLYREVCAVLFFRYGITPTANKLYQYVRKGSMSAPAEALAKFWEDLREKSRVRIEHPDLPEALKAVAGELVSSLWGQAQVAAQESFAALRSEAAQSVNAAQLAQATAIEQLRKTAEELAVETQRRQAAEAHVRTLELEVSSERSRRGSLEEQLIAARKQQANTDDALADARRDFTAELEKVREALLRSEERGEAAEKRALIAIDHERTLNTKLQKELLLARQSQSDTLASHREAVDQLHEEIGVARQELGATTGQVHELRSTNQKQTDQIEALRIALAESETKNALLQRDIQRSGDKVIDLEHQIQRLSAELSAQAKKRPKPRTS